MKILVVVNPRAGSGTAVQVGDALCRALGDRGIAYEREESRSVGDATRLARSAAGRDANVVVAIGGDGTFNEVAQTLLDERGDPAPGPELCLIPAGTGSDLGRTLGLETEVLAVVERLGREPRAIDLGVVEFCTGVGTQRSARAFLNVASTGLSAVVAGRSNRAPKWLGGRLTYLGASLLSALGYRNARVSVLADKMPHYDGPVSFVAFCNGRYFGGAMLIAPNADPHDGQLDCVLLGDLNKFQTYALSSHLYEGTHVSRLGVSVARGREFEVLPNPPGERVAIEIDGETPGILPATFRVIPNAVKLRC
jgi:diacylglycerol kinase (ATP)